MPIPINKEQWNCDYIYWDADDKVIGNTLANMLGENSCRGTPSSIPNLEVKPVNAESTWREASWEDRNSPSFFYFLEFCKPLFLMLYIKNK